MPHQSLDVEITVQAFAALRSEHGTPPMLLDVREAWEFQTANLRDSVLMPMGDITSRAHAELDPDQHLQHLHPLTANLYTLCSGNRR